MREKDIENEIKNYLNHTLGFKYNSFCYKLHGNNIQGKGLPDIIGSHKGIPFAVEIKYNTEVRQEQMLTLRLFKQGGYVVGVVRSLDEFKALFGDKIAL